ncbi:MAG: branched-chain amino acid transport system substrate-binding protein [Solirubrobacteraceae bacterium]|jgi:branched-chain amino acid transport system substrate-binding protein|nr:branched-chain amino acid transport system substrate-binding protein [Solirubrobacteraceae bacterium]
MKRIITVAVALAALTASGCGSSSNNNTTSGTTTKAATANACTTSIAIEGPFTGPVSQLGLEQLDFAKLAVALDNAANKTNVTLNQDDTQLTPSIAVNKTQAVIASPAVAVVGPAGSQEVNAVGPLFGRAGVAFVTGSATLPSLATSGKNPTFFRVVPDDNVQGPQDANYIVNHLKPKAVLLIDDAESYSQGLANVMTPILKKAGITVNRQSYNGTDTGATLNNALSSLVTSQLNASETVTILPWQTASNAQTFGLDAQQQHKKTILFGTDGTNIPSQFHISGSYVSAFGPDISLTKTPLDNSLVAGVAKYGPYGSFGVPTYQAADVVMKAIASVCQAGQTPSRSNVLAAIKTTNIPTAETPLAAVVKFEPNGDLFDHPGYLFKVNSAGKYLSIPNK